MIFLVLNIVFSSAFMLCIKWVQARQREDVITVGLVNYIAAALLILPQMAATTTGPTTGWAAGLGGAMGVCYFLAFFLVTHMVRLVGASASTVVGVLSILVPIIVGVWLWGESPNRFQVVGIALALAALLLSSGQHAASGASHDVGRTRLILLLFFMLAGMNRVLQDAFRHLCDGPQRPIFLLAAFTVATIPSLAMLWLRRRRLQPLEVVIGLGLGLANLLQSYFILRALQQTPGFIVFPVARRLSPVACRLSPVACSL